ncbi:hypothetical protein AID18_005040, partial [Salmonella enterica subsp. enterica serovar Reading]|nr:hypothetical protein [Salmonella enterica subsp. enterica]EGI6131827.1 hypothetical protein [Salmonella enterica subsp. enterica serovar Reading]
AQGVAQADDLAAAGKQDVQDTFGQNSTMMYYFMIAEVFLVFMLYLRNHNPATFVLIPVKALTARFNRALSDSLTAYQREHRAVIIVAPAVVGGAEDITADIQQAVAARMAEGT